MSEEKKIDFEKLNKPIPTKRYFTISEVSELCQVKPHVLRYWEQEFNKLRPNKRGNRRYYQYDEVLLVRKIRDLLYGQLFTIKGARAVLNDDTGYKTAVGKATLVDSPHSAGEQTIVSRVNPFTDDANEAEDGSLFFYPSADQNTSDVGTRMKIDITHIENEIRSIMSLLEPKAFENKTSVNN